LYSEYSFAGHGSQTPVLTTSFVPASQIVHTPGEVVFGQHLASCPVPRAQGTHPRHAIAVTLIVKFSFMYVVSSQDEHVGLPLSDHFPVAHCEHAVEPSPEEYEFFSQSEHCTLSDVKGETGVIENFPAAQFLHIVPSCAF
jgi:hypothetical protein